MAIQYTPPVKKAVAPWDEEPLPKSENIRKIEKTLERVVEKNKVDKKPVKRKAKTKVQIALRLDPEVLEWFRATGPGWQVRMQDILSDYAEMNK